MKSHQRKLNKLQQYINNTQEVSANFAKEYQFFWQSLGDFNAATEIETINKTSCNKDTTNRNKEQSLTKTRIQQQSRTHISLLNAGKKST